MRKIQSASRSLTERAGVVLILLHVFAMALIQALFEIFTNTLSASGAPRLRYGTGSQCVSGAMSPLQWRAPWWPGQLLAWVIATLTSPTFLLIGSLLAINSHSDYPLFWWSLPAIVAISNAIAVLCINQQHHRCPFVNPRTLARHHVAVSMITGTSLFLLIGTISGFLPDIAVPLSSAIGVALPPFTSALYSLLLGTFFSVLSFSHSGFLLASLGFQHGRTLPLNSETA